MWFNFAMRKRLFTISYPFLTLLLSACEFTLPSLNLSSISSSITSHPTSLTTSTLTSMNPEETIDFATPPPVPNLQLPSGVCEPTSTPRVSENAPEEFTLFFHPTTQVMIDFSMTNANLRLMNQYGNRTEDHDRYVPASIRIDVLPANGTTISYCYPTVGIRMKGNTSRLDFIEESGALKNFVNLKVSFSSDNPTEPRNPNQQFLGMTRMDLKWNRNFDHTYVRQVFTHKLYQHYLPFAQEATLGGVRFLQSGVSEEHQDNYLGVYTIIEPMDRRFFARRLGDGPEADGNLYKVLYSPTGAADFTKFNAIESDGTTHRKVGNKIGVENNQTNYHPSYDLKTNTTNATFMDIVNLIGELNASQNPNDASYRTRVEAVIDLPSFLMMEAIAYFVGNPDDYRNNANNLYVYFLPSTGKAYFIPYDLDRGFGSNGDWDPTDEPFGQYGPSMTKATPYQTALLKDWNQGRLNPLHKLTIYEGAYAGYRTQYTANLNLIYRSDWLGSTALGNGNYTGAFYRLHQTYRSNYYPQSGDFTFLRPTSPALNDIFVPFSLNQKTLENLTYHEYISAKINTYLQAIS